MTGPRVLILGTRGVPAAHGGFETFAEKLAPYLVGRGWEVAVYCQEAGRGPVWTDRWEGVERIHIPVPGDGARATIHFDWLATRHAARERGLILTLGYNTAIFNGLFWLRRRRNVINMDGIEWKRAKWSGPIRAWFRANEAFGRWFGTHLVADNPGIADHLAQQTSRSNITTIAYGADAIGDVDASIVGRLGLEPERYMTVIARPEPENSILEIVTAFSGAPRGVRLLVLGKFAPDNAYHRRVKAVAGPEVLFPGAIYGQDVQALRRYCLAYLHGHQVGGTNPSLVEAMAAGNAIIAHDNKFNRWVAGEGALYFGDVSSCADAIALLIGDPRERERRRALITERWRHEFTWERVLGEYEMLLARFAADGEPRAQAGGGGA